MADTIVINGRPVPYVRTTQKQKYVDKSYKRYQTFKQFVVFTVLNQMQKISYNDKLVEVDVKIHLCGGGKYKMGNDGDIDNYIKGALDSLNGIAFDDDRQVMKCSGEKVMCSDSSSERMVIEIKEYGE